MGGEGRGPSCWTGNCSSSALGLCSPSGAVVGSRGRGAGIKSVRGVGWGGGGGGGGKKGGGGGGGGGVVVSMMVQAEREA